MNKCVFTLGLILTFIYTTTAMADWPETAVKLATDVWDDSAHTTLAEMYCADCCKNDCWLPNGTYYDNTGRFSRSCTGEPTAPTCISGRTYSVVNGVCTYAAYCDNRQGLFDIGLSVCANANISGNDMYDYDSSEGTWNVEFEADGYSYTVYGAAAATNWSGTYAVALLDHDFDIGQNNGEHCWCKVTMPQSSPRPSLWVYLQRVMDLDDCVQYCTWEVNGGNKQFLEELYRAVGQSPAI